MSRHTSFVAMCSLLLVFALYSTAALGQCSLSSPDSWQTAGSGQWTDGGNWSGGVPTSSTNTCITNGTMADPTIVNLTGGANGSVNNLQLGGFDTLNIDANSDFTVSGTQIINAGQINLNAGSGGPTILVLDNDVTLSGAGTLTLNSSGGQSAYIQQGVGGLTLTNQSTINGAGIIGNGGLALNNQGTIDANSSGQTLFLNGSGGITNTSTLEATGGGVLQITSQTVNNAGGTITSGAGSSVQLQSNTVIQGGTLTNNGGFLGVTNSSIAYLDGSTAAGAVTINGTYTSDTNTYTYVRGSIINNGTIQLNGGGGTSVILWTDSPNVMLTGGGTLNLGNLGGGGTAIIDEAAGGETLTNVNNLIEGQGVIGDGSGLVLVNQATVNANVSGQSLTLDGGGVTNTGLLEATNGGVLVISSQAVNNQNGNITAGAGSSVVLEGAVVQGGTLTNNGSFLGATIGGIATLDGSTASGAVTINGTYTSDINSYTYLKGTINNQGTIQINAGAGDSTVLWTDSGNVMLTGGGTVNLSTVSGTGTAYIAQTTGGQTLTNVNNLIEGFGVIGDNGLTLVNEATVNANVSGQTLLLNGGSVTNTGLLEATNGGTLEITGTTVTNGGANITAGAGSSVLLDGNSRVVGGTLNSSGTFLGTAQGANAYLDGSTAAGAVTINGTYTSALNTDTYLLGTITNNGNIQVNGGSGFNTLLLTDSGTVTLQGGGTVTLSSSTSGGGGNAYLAQAAGGETLINVNNIIQGDGVIGDNGLTLINQVGGTINANSTGVGQLATLTLDDVVLTNAGLIEATNNGVLNIDGVTVNNAGGTITGIGSGTSVNLYGNTTIEGGTLTNNGAAFFGTTAGNNAFLDGSTQGAITINGTYTSALNTDTYVLGTINNNGTLQINGGSGFNTLLLTDSPDVTLQGGGTVILSTSTGGQFAYLAQAAGGETLTNVNNLIQGDGIIGDNGLTLINTAGGTINANSTGGSQITTLTLDNLALTNEGLVEATNNGVLQIDGITVNNTGGTITGIGSGASVELYGNARINGGTLTNNGAAFFGTLASGNAYLDGSTGAGAVTINGTYTGDLNSDTYLLGTINNKGTIQINGGDGSNTDLIVNNANVTLTGGGVVNLSTAAGGGTAVIYQSTGGSTLENVNNTIQGVGIVGDNGLSLLNDAAGTVLANVSGGTLTLDGIGTLTNNGTFQANAGSTLLVENVTDFTNFSGHTLTGGTYNVYGTLSNPGTMQLSVLGNTGGEIVNNAATILLDGPNSNITDEAGLNALSNFSNNEATGSFTIQDGRNFTSPNNTDFSNAGIVNIGAGSTFTTGGTGNYVQSGGTTQLDGMLTAGGGQANFNGGTLYGNGGTINGNVMMAGTIVPAGTINGFGLPLAAGLLTINGNYTQTASGIFNLGIGGLAAGTQFGLLNVTGNALLNGTLDVSLINGFFPTVGESFTFLTTGGSVSDEFATVNGLNIGHGEDLTVIYGPNYVEITVGALSGTDLWLGGTDNWSNGAKWSIGVPQPAYDVVIYSGGADLVTLNVGSATVNSLAIGGPSNGFTSELTDNGTAQTLAITNGLTIGQQGILDFTGNGSSITAATVTNDGSVTIGKGATLNLTNQPNGVTDVAAGASWTIGGNFAVGGVANTGFANLASIEGAVYLQNGASQNIDNALTIAGGGALDVSNGTTLNINGDLSNSGAVSTGQFGTGGNTLTATGALTNSGTFELLGSKDMATIGSLTNNGNANSGGFVDVEGGSTLKITGDVTNNANPPSGMGQNGIYTSFNGTGGNTITIGGMLTNNGYFELLGPGDMGSIGNGVSNAVVIYVENGSTLDITGNVLNNGDLVTIANGLGMGGSTLNITGNLTNNLSFGWLASGDKGTITGNVSNNGLGAQFFVFNGAMGNVGGTFTNSGLVDVEGGGTLNVIGDVTNNASGPEGIYTSFNGTGNNTIDIGGTLTNNGMVGVESTGDTLTVAGAVTNNDGGLIALTGGSTGTLESGLTNNAGAQVDLENASTLTIDGAVSNSGTLSTSGFGGTGGNTLTITGMLTNNGTLLLNGPADMATIGNGVSNSATGIIDLENSNNTLSITGDVTNNGTIETDLNTNGSGNMVIITGNLNNPGSFALYGTGDTVMITGTLTNSGSFDVLGTDEQATISGAVTNSNLLELAGNGSMTSTGALNNTGAVEVFNGATLQVNGDFTNSGAGSLITGFYGTGGNTVNITGMLTNNNGGTFDLLGAGDMASIGNGMTNSGTVDVENGSTLQITGAVTNSGTMETNANGFGGSNTITVGGLLTNTPTGIIQLNGSMDMLQALAGITNSGTINVNNSSTIDPPFFNNLGTLNIDHTSMFVVGTGAHMGTGYIQLANGTLGEMISSTAFGVINVNGSALLNGTLDILLQGGFDPSIGSTYKFVLTNPGQVNGTFASIMNDIFNGGTEKWGVDYDSADGYVELIAEENTGTLPEPGVLFTLIPGLLGAGFLFRRQLFR